MTNVLYEENIFNFNTLTTIINESKNITWCKLQSEIPSNNPHR